MSAPPVQDAHRARPHREPATCTAAAPIFPDICAKCAKGARLATPGERPRAPQGSRIAMIGLTNLGSTSHGNRIQVSWLTSVTKVSTTGRPAGLAYTVA